MRSGKRLWMVTFADGRDTSVHEEIPQYFRTRKAAQAWVDEPDTLEWLGYNADDALVVQPAPDDIREDDIVWDYPE
jgi:hypothetical protein